MITKTEADRANRPVRVYHRAGTVDGRKDEKFAWTHPIKDRPDCEACQLGTIPLDIQRSPS